MEDTWKNKLFFGDNLKILRDKEKFPDEFVDLIYLDPPFNSNATYNILFEEKSGEKSEAQITAFEDTWHWGKESEKAYYDVIAQGPGKLPGVLDSLRSLLGTNDMMAYLTMMAVRLIELRRILKETGSIYLHCDPTASHYLKILMDATFGAKNYMNEIIWCYKERERVLPKWNKKHDIILFYCKNVETPRVFNWKSVIEQYSNVTLSKFKYQDEKGNYQIRGRNVKGSPVRAADGLRPEHEKLFPGLTYRDYLEERTGVAPRDWWEIGIINKASRERLGYPTQKPESLLERIIKASSNEGDVVLDPFCGCGTAIAVAERLHRKWVGIDITHLAITLIINRLKTAFENELSEFEIYGDPKDIASARALARQNRYQFEWWALGKVFARPAQEKKKGPDTGIDGLINFIDDPSGKAKKLIIQVKSGKVAVSHVRDLKGVVEREKAAVASLITLNDPTGPMIQEAATAGFYEPEYLPGMRFPKLQILTISEIFEGKGLEYPRIAPDVTFKKAPRQRKNPHPSEKQNNLL
jgi:site-specific DNA-methyltransferase (adenine-specific)